MGDATRFDVEKLISYSDDLVEFLKNDNDVTTLKQCLQQSQTLKFRCDADFNHLQHSIEEYQKKIDACGQKIAQEKSEVAGDEEIDLLQKKLEEELRRERVLKEELRVIADKINDLEHQSLSIEEHRQALKKLEQYDFRAQMKLSMYASVTSIIPNLDDQSKISGHIVDRDKKAVENFALNPVKQTTFETCNSIWKMIKL